MTSCSLTLKHPSEVKQKQHAFLSWENLIFDTVFYTTAYQQSANVLLYVLRGKKAKQLSSWGERVLRESTWPLAAETSLKPVVSEFVKEQVFPHDSQYLSLVNINKEPQFFH